MKTYETSKAEAARERRLKRQERKASLKKKSLVFRLPVFSEPDRPHSHLPLGSEWRGWKVGCYRWGVGAKGDGIREWGRGKEKLNEGGCLCHNVVVADR